MAKLRRRAALSEVPVPRCPAAAVVAGTTPDRAGIICGVMLLDRQLEDGVGYNPAQLAVARDGSDGVLLTAKGDPSTIERMCCADRSVPVLDNREKVGGRDSYTYCPIWQAKRDSELAGEKGIAPRPVNEPESVSMGVSSIEAADPWAAARTDLDVLAGE